MQLPQMLIVSMHVFYLFGIQGEVCALALRRTTAYLRTRDQVFSALLKKKKIATKNILIGTQ